MFNSNQIENATPWELQCQLEAIEENIQQAELLLNRLKFSRNDLKIALCIKINGEHKFINGKCGCGAINKNVQFG